MWGKFHKILDEEMRLVRQKEKHRFDWYLGWYHLDSDRDQIVDYAHLLALTGDEEDAQALVDVIGNGKTYITKEETYTWWRDIEEPALADIRQLEIVLFPGEEEEFVADLVDFLSDPVRDIIKDKSDEELTQIFNMMDANKSGFVSSQELCYNYLPGAKWICKHYWSEDGDVEPPVDPPVDPDNPDFEKLWDILTSVSDGKVTLSDYKAVSHMIWPDASDVHVELTFGMHDLDDNGVVEEHEARKVVSHTPIL